MPQRSLPGGVLGRLTRWITGRKSKRQGGDGGASSEPSTSPSEPNNVTLPSSNVDDRPAGASCWLCLGEGPDEAGQPFVRDCSCRGNSGFAHFRCLVEYAEKKSLELEHRAVEQGESEEPFSSPWMTCRNCKQNYQGALSINLMESLLSFTKKSFPCHPSVQCPEFPCDPVKYIEALGTKSVVVWAMCCNILKEDSVREYYRAEAKTICGEILAVIGKMKALQVEAHPGSSIPYDVIGAEATAHEVIGLSIVSGINLNQAKQLSIDERELRSALKHFEESRSLFGSIGASEKVTKIDHKIAHTNQWFSGKSMKNSIEAFSRQYEDDPKPATAIPLILALRDEYRTIECERILSAQIALSRRVHGPDNEKTIALEDQYEQIRMRRVCLISPGHDWRSIYVALRYEDDGKKCVVQGPWWVLGIGEEGTTTVKEEERKTITVDAEELSFSRGTPVVCHGLKNASHLNGKIGDIRGFNNDSLRHVVHFEDKRLKPCLVKEQNLRIVFDLPPKAD